MSSISSTAIQPNTGKSRRFLTWLRMVGLGLVLVIGIIVFNLVRLSYIPDNLNTDEVRMSEHGSYQVSYVPELKPVPINQIQTWTIRVTDPSGQPVENASITVDGGMPQHGHGLPTVPKVTDYLGDALYRVEGMKFHMSGWWVVKFTINYNGTTDTVTFNLMLK